MNAHATPIGASPPETGSERQPLHPISREESQQRCGTAGTAPTAGQAPYRALPGGSPSGRGVATRSARPHPPGTQFSQQRAADAPLP
jgi:hypothetical protein